LLHAIPAPDMNQDILEIVKPMATHQHSCPQLVVFKSRPGLIIPGCEHGSLTKHHGHMVERVSESRDSIEFLGSAGHAPERLDLRAVAVELGDGAAHQVHFWVLFKKGHLLLESVGQADVVRIHPGHKLSSALGEAGAQRRA
jgi:hypothetical protein